ncbi:MAG: 50S ribosomal protein L5 [Planctomycetota bacterium]|nr:50S ribosomal protein L5 [Planctomycetota bacterium]
MARLLELYRKEIVPKMMEKFKYKNVMEVPRIEKIVVSMGVGKAKDDRRFLDGAARDLAAITGQQPKLTKAKQHIAGFRLRKGQLVGCFVTLRGKRMYEFLDRFVNIALPRVRDFRGVSPTAFDNFGNFSQGLSDQFVFPEVDIDKSEGPQGMNVTIVIGRSSKEESMELLKLFGIPFYKPGKAVEKTVSKG